MPLPTAIYSTSQVRELDDHAIQALGVPGYSLMKRAGEAGLRMMRTRWPMAHEIAVVCGGGNNGGDGYVLARFAQAAGLKVQVLAVTPPAQLRGDAQRAHDDFVNSGGTVVAFAAPRLAHGDVIVDALLGTGLRGNVRPEIAGVIRALNICGKPIFSLDIPSGLSGDTGLPLGDAVRADCTLTFVGLKTGLYLGDGPEYTGNLLFDDLEVTPPGSPDFKPRLTRIVEAEVGRVLPRRMRTAHKGDFGHVVVLGGGVGMPGAARLAGEAALRVGAGLVTVATASGNFSAIAAGIPELMVHAVEDPSSLTELLARADVIAVGPGLGQSDWARGMLSMALAADRPVVVDADALNLLAAQGAAKRGNWILTPHPGEAARLLGCRTSEVQGDRLAALERLVARFGGVVVLKGAGTLIGAPQKPSAFCERGNPGMAAPGMGDVLTGAIAGVLAQHADPWAAAQVGVLVHSLAGDALARSGERGLFASELARELRVWVNLQ